jgi:hypothetical protein
LTYIQRYRGRARCRTFYQYGVHRLMVAVECRVEGLPNSLVALFDTGAEWSVLPTAVAQAIEFGPDYDEPVEELSARGHRLTGRRVIIPVSFPAEEGYTLDLPNASWFVPDAWTGPLIIGWSGCLEAFRFAFDPTPDHEYLYFDADPNDTMNQ